MRRYETALLIAPNISEEETDQLIQQIEGVIAEKKGKMVNLDKWGKRRMAYQIKKFDEAFYVFFLYDGTPDIPAELERRFKQTDAVLRYLTVLRDLKDNIRKTRKKKVRRGGPRSSRPRPSMSSSPRVQRVNTPHEPPAKTEESKKEE